MADFAFKRSPERFTSDYSDFTGPPGAREWTKKERQHVIPTNGADRGPLGMDKYLASKHDTPELGHGDYSDVAKHHGYVKYGARSGGKRGVLWEHPSGSKLTFESNDRGPERNPTRANTWHHSE